MQLEDFHDTDEMDMSDDSQDLPRSNKRFKSDTQHTQVSKLNFVVSFSNKAVLHNL